ncbi:efflux RND transporter permease subunit [Shewanella violacea]|uniref:Membrane protein, putative n=1 Tax=Shewanella violacea (strain JCM 10179 / CIP 106290 / LMG 19151 / DSS12) TaxID=637905 RepID=D4ZDP7_SHEVD|nr:MMPL family transporter [Shewanella violacea]BAJ03958.1 membrane protein, putative [Shewanella violacea DSS12]
MNNFINAWAKFVINQRLMVIIISIFLLAVGGYFAGSIAFDQTIERNFEKGDPKLAEFNQLLDLFGDNEYLLLGISAKKSDRDILTQETLAVVDSLTKFLETQPAVTQVRSISKYQFIKGEGDSLLVVDLFRHQSAAHVSDGEISRARDILATEKLVQGVLVSKDLTETRIAARIEYQRQSPAHKVALVKSLYKFVEEQGFSEQGYRIRYGGQPVFDEQFETLNKSDGDLLYPVMVLIMMLVLFICFRSVLATFVPWLVIIFTIVMLSGLQGGLGFPQSAVSQALMPTIIIVGIGVTMHLLLEFFRLQQTHSSKDAIEQAMTQLWIPSFYTAITTALGFITLSVTKIVPVKEMAYLGAAGVMMLFILSFTLLPAVLSYAKNISVKTQAVMTTGWVTRFTQQLPEFVYRYRLGIMLIALSLAIFSVFTLPKIKVDTNFVEYFKSSNTARQDMQYFDETFNGALTLELIIDSGKIDGAKSPSFLTRVDALQQYLESRVSTGEIVSQIDYLKEVYQSLNEEQSEFYTLPGSSDQVAQSLFLYENAGPEEDLSDLRDFDNRYLRLTVPMINMAASEVQVELEQIKQDLANNYSDLNITLTGLKILFQAQDIYTNHGMFYSFTLTLCFISLFFILLFRSFKYGLLCIIPSVLPIMITGGGIALLGLKLDLGTMIVGAMTMGIAVDDSIHVMSRYLTAKKSGHSTHKAISLAMAHAGRAVILSSVVLVLGFSVLMLASFVPIIYVGVFSACIMFLALLGDLFILPATLYLLDGDKVNIEDAVVIDKGDTA